MSMFHPKIPLSFFIVNLIRSNGLTGNETGDDVIKIGEEPISVCLRNEDYSQYVFYTENTQSVKMDLSNSKEELSAVAVDTRRPYKEIDIGPSDPASMTWKAPYPSTWAIAVGDSKFLNV